MRPSLLICSAALALLPLCACAPHSNHADNRYADDPQLHENRSQQGRVTGIEQLRPKSSGGGALLGAVVGGVVGNQVGGGRGRTAATGVGALSGAVVGNQMEKNAASAQGSYRISVDFDDGHRAEFNYESIGDLQIGDRVRVDNGQITRM